MSTRQSIASILLAGLLGTSCPAALADPDEAWVRRAEPAPGTRPLVAVLVDTSAAMGRTLEVPASYDPARVYPGECRVDRVYWMRGSGPVPHCASGQSIALAAADARTGWRCDAGADALARHGFHIASRAAQWEARPGGGYWREPRAGSEGAVECRADRGRHGSVAGTWYAVEGSPAPWGAGAEQEIRWDAPPLSDPYVFFAGNYLNYRAQATPTHFTTLLEWTLRQLSVAASTVEELDLALVRPSHDGGDGDAAAEGGMVVMAGGPLPGASERIAQLTADWIPAGPAPLGEATAELGAWISGQEVHFGDTSHAAPGSPLPSSADSRLVADPSRYRSPFSDACRPVTVGLATAAVASADAGAPGAAARLPGFQTPDCTGDCLPEILRWLTNSDLMPSLPGRQFASVQVVGPGDADASALALSRAAGSGLLDLRDPLAIALLLARALGHDAAAGGDTSTRVSQPAFLRDDGTILFGLSEPRYRPRWLGNLRRYRLEPGASATAAPSVVDADGEPAFDPATGRPRPGSRSLWSQAADGATAIGGGAAGRLPPPSQRVLLSDLTSASLGAASNRIAADNPALTREVLGLVPTDSRTLGELVEWLRGADSFDADGDGDRSSPLNALGDPGTRAPVVIRHASGADATVLLVTGDGLLHAIDVESGVERWAFVPAPLLARTAALAAAGETAARVPGEPGGLAVSLVDGNGDGRIDPSLGESAQVVFGFGRLGTGYYALDVSQPSMPALRWSLTAGDLPDFGASWPEPVITRMALDDARQSSGRRVVVLAGGYDAAERVGDLAAADPGASLVIVDADTGALLWMAAGRDSPLASVVEPDMRHGLPSAPRVIDRDGDGFADLLYAVDLKGQLWRVDVPRPDAGTAVPQVRRIADLSDPDGRRFFLHTPDAVYETIGARPRIVVALGSGRLSRPRATDVVDHFYAIFDEVTALPAGTPPITGASLVDATDATTPIPVEARGWLRRLDAHGPGEKVAGASSTFDHRLRFTTHQPLAPFADAPCGPPQARNRLYTLDVRTGRAAHRVDDEEVPSEDLAGDGLPVGLDIVAPRLFEARCAAGACNAPLLLHGGLVREIEFTNRVRTTSWRQLERPAQ